ncbi:MAG TPA: circadian clock KaiB family protein [Blastocatellia bacterium]|nr:circadian clock KaiB family protein [Blastocatellia bacterium]
MNGHQAPGQERNALAEFEQALVARQQKYVFRLYVTGASPRSMRALNNLKRICEEYLAGRYELEVVDIYQQPQQAAREQIIAAPTLVKMRPLPQHRFVGTLSNTRDVLLRLGIERLNR